MELYHYSPYVPSGFGLGQIYLDLNLYLILWR